MPLKLKSPLPPMEALSVDAIPTGDGWQYEPKWDGFRCLAFRDGDKVQLQSKSNQPLERYFPEVVAMLRTLKAKQFVLDGELVVPVKELFSFDQLLQRIHPAASRVKKLAAETPATFIVFDLLADERGNSLVQRTLAERRERLEKFAAKQFAEREGIQLSPATTEFKTAKKWFKTVGGNLDGIVAKRLDLEYRSGERDGMQKIKLLRTADCVVGGFRYAEGKKVVGSLLLGLYDKQGLLHHVGFSSAFKQAERERITELVEQLIKAPGFTGKAPGGPSRWSNGRSEKWEPLAPKLVVEVQYDHFTGDRFRHGAKLLRWRPDKAPEQCKYDQVARRGGKTSKQLLPSSE